MQTKLTLKSARAVKRCNHHWMFIGNVGSVFCKAPNFKRSRLVEEYGCLNCGKKEQRWHDNQRVRVR